MLPDHPAVVRSIKSAAESTRPYPLFPACRYCAPSHSDGSPPRIPTPLTDLWILLLFNQDTVVSLEMGEGSKDRLEALGYAVDFHRYAMAHSICTQEIADMGAWIQR